ncbi:uncharacterized protein SPSK_01877 [Sporothrix schenckii 1099-18]|uniref:Casein kinase substrate phosphoprotein PP28 domain-containing protein n=1 Tax=Sporothrix schenckii 1099-18 TaxID=1397361 RepID=A0A0F2MEZ1_SPOSC|nr:uncharacterized protein SPSK_01877 [Sporothrix schenckii 1099-18]KJR87415.1 hypothetical protein SPSK_01877 [Sporothrix schenckii 1099-18]
MAGGQAPGANSRGRGGKFRKFTRGGGKHFSRNLRPLDADGNEISMWSEDGVPKQNGSDDSEDDDSEEDSEEEEDSDDAAPSSSAALAASAASREDRKKEKKARKEAAIARAKGQAVQVGDLPSSEDESDDEDLPANPNHSRAARSQTKVASASGNRDVDEAGEGVKDLSLGGTAAPQSRRERESLEAQQAKERYRKLHEQGKTDEAKADLARLKIIREKREAEAARKQAEKEEREALEKARREETEAREAKKREAALGKPKKAKK